MGPSGARAGIPFPGASSSGGSVRAASVPRSIVDPVSDSGEGADTRDMEVDTEPTATHVPQTGAEPSTSLPSIKNLFGIEPKEPLASVKRADGVSDDGHSSLGTATPSSPAALHAASSSQTIDRRGLRGHASTSSFSEFQSGLSHSASSSSLGPIRTRHSSNASGSYGRSGPIVPSTPPRHPGPSTHPFSVEDAGPRRRVDSRSRQAQALKGLILSPPTRRPPLDGDGHGSDMPASSQRRSGHRPASSSSGSLSTLFSHISTASDPAPMLPPGYVPSTHTSEESMPHEGWGAASANSDTTSPRTSWHSRSSTLESGEGAYKMMGADRPSGSLLPPFREGHYSLGEPSRPPPEQHYSNLSRHRSMRTPGASADLPGSASQPLHRPRARTLTHSDRPIAPLPNSDDPARKQRLEAASELLRMGQQRAEDPGSMGSGRMYSHKHSLSMQERAPLPLELYENASTIRTHRPKSHSMSGQEPYNPDSPLHHAPPGMPAPGLGPPSFDRGGPPPGPGMFDSFHPRRGRGAGDDGPRPGGAGWVFPRRPMPSETAEAQRNAFQAQMMRGQGLPSVPDGIISAQHRGGFGGVRAAPSTTGTIASGQAKYECAWCGKRFSRPSSLKIHHHSHTGEKPFVCNEPGCGRSFSVQSNLRRHQKCHASGGDQPEMDAARQQQGAGSHRGDEGYWARGPAAAASAGSRMSPIAGGSGAWHPGYGPGPGPSQNHGHAYGVGYPQSGPMPPQMQVQMQMQMHMKDHPPLSRSAYEPGSRSMNTWTEMRRGEMPPPGYRDYDRGGPAADAYGTAGSPRRFTQMQDRRLEESSGEEEEEDELRYEEEHTDKPDVRAEQSKPRRRRGDADSATKGSASGGGTSEDEGDITVTIKTGTRPRSETSASTTSNLRVGFDSLLNPEDKKSDSRVKQEL